MKKTLLATLSAVLVIALAISGTLAYLITENQNKSNIFSVGKVSIQLNEETGILRNGEEIATIDNGTTSTYVEVLPGDYLKKEVSIANTGNKPAYVAVSVTLNNADLINLAIDEVYENESYNYTEAQVQDLYNAIFDGWGWNYTHTRTDDGSNDMRGTISGSDMPENVLHVDSTKTTDVSNDTYLFSNKNWFMSDAEKAVAANGGYSTNPAAIGYYSESMGDYEINFTYYILLEKGESTTLFKGLNIPAEFNADQLAMFDNLKIDVKASAIQADNIPAMGEIGSAEHAKVAFAILAGDKNAPDDWNGTADTSWYDEDITEYNITTAEQLAGLAKLVNAGNTFKDKTILLAKDLDLAGMEWTPIGTHANGFSGTFDGQGHMVSNYKVTELVEYAGLFGYALNGGNFKNLTVNKATIVANDRAGALLGAGYTKVENCHAVNCVVTVTPYLKADGITWDGGAKAGAVVGQLFENAGTMINCSAKNVKVAGYRDIGAVLGMAHNNNSITDLKAYNSEVAYIYLDAGTVYDDGKTPNQNIGEVVGRRNPGVVESGTEFENVTLKKYDKTASTVEELEDALTSGNSVVLTGDVTVSSTMTVAKSATSTINLNGHDLSYAVTNSGASAIITNKGNLTIEGEGTISFVAENPDMQEIPSYATNTITNEGTLTIGEGVVVKNESDGGASYAVDNQGVFTLNGGTLIGKRCALRIAKFNQDDVQFTMNSGLVQGATPAWIHLPGSDSNVAPTITVTINGGTFQTTKETSADNDVIYTYSFGNSHANTAITINGGEFLGGTVSIGSGYKGDVAKLTIKGGTFEYDVLQWLENDQYKVLYTANK